jgi:hypothetical protein
LERSEIDEENTRRGESASANLRSPVVEAQAWVMNDKGQVELVAQVPQVTPQFLAQTSYMPYESLELNSTPKFFNVKLLS